MNIGETTAIATSLTLILAVGAALATAAQDPVPSKGDPNQAKTEAEAGATAAATGPDILLVPPFFASDPKLANGCWARLYDGANFEGNVLSLVGPIDVPKGRIGSDYAWGHKYDSLVVGPSATLTIYDGENYRQKTATFKPGKSLPDLNVKLGPFENIRSLKITCLK